MVKWNLQPFSEWEHGVSSGDVSSRESGALRGQKWVLLHVESERGRDSEHEAADAHFDDSRREKKTSATTACKNNLFMICASTLSVNPLKDGTTYVFSYCIGYERSTTKSLAA
jgi:hypothetical protein